jgi:flagellar biosynthesis anti-sigma factor FlgM
MVDSVTFGTARPVPQSRLFVTKVPASKRADTAPPTNARSLSLASALAQMGPPFDAGKVASLKAAIASGSYQINLGEIADGIVRFGLNDQAA